MLILEFKLIDEKTRDFKIPVKAFNILKCLKINPINRFQLYDIFIWHLNTDINQQVVKINDIII